MVCSFMTSYSSARAVARAVLVAAGLALALPALAAGSSDTTPTPPAISEVNAVLKTGNYGAAISMLNQILEQDAGNADALNLMGYSLRKSGNWKRGEAFYLRALKINPKHRGANEYLGELYVETGRIDKANERLGVLKTVCGTDCEEYKDLAEAIAKGK